MKLTLVAQDNNTRKIHLVLYEGFQTKGSKAWEEWEFNHRPLEPEKYDDWDMTYIGSILGHHEFRKD